MEDNQNPETQQQPNKPSDVEIFLDMLPQLVGSFAAKHNEAPTAANLAIHLARETTGQLAMLGVCDQVHVCTDGYPLALVGGQAPGQNPSGIPRSLSPQLGNGHSRQGAMVTMFETNQVQKIQGL